MVGVTRLTRRISNDSVGIRVKVNARACVKARAKALARASIKKKSKIKTRVNTSVTGTARVTTSVTGTASVTTSVTETAEVTTSVTARRDMRALSDDAIVEAFPHSERRERERVRNLQNAGNEDEESVSYEQLADQSPSTMSLLSSMSQSDPPPPVVIGQAEAEATANQIPSTYVCETAPGSMSLEQYARQRKHCSFCDMNYESYLEADNCFRIHRLERCQVCLRAFRLQNSPDLEQHYQHVHNLNVGSSNVQTIIECLFCKQQISFDQFGNHVEKDHPARSSIGSSGDEPNMSQPGECINQMNEAVSQHGELETMEKPGKSAPEDSANGKKSPKRALTAESKARPRSVQLKMLEQLELESELELTVKVEQDRHTIPMEANADSGGAAAPFYISLSPLGTQFIDPGQRVILSRDPESTEPNATTGRAEEAVTAPAPVVGQERQEDAPNGVKVIPKGA